MQRLLPENILAESPLWDGLDGGVLVSACSGGKDSVALALAASRLLADESFVDQFITPPKLVLWHLDHRLRAESGDDALFVQELASHLNCDAVIEAAPARDGQSDPQNTEAWARQVRYMRILRFMAETAGESELPTKVAAMTAHHLGDQAETVLHHIVRGTHLSGIRGIAPVFREFIYRPWLGLPPEELGHYLNILGQFWREDNTNQDTSLTRNRIRHNVIPELLAINSRARENIARLAKVALFTRAQTQEQLSELEVEVYDMHDIDRWHPLLSWPEGEVWIHKSRMPWDNPMLLAEYCQTVLSGLGKPLNRNAYAAIAAWAEAPSSQMNLDGFVVWVAGKSALILLQTEQEGIYKPELEISETGVFHIGGLQVALCQAGRQEYGRQMKAEKHAYERIISWPQAIEEMAGSPPSKPSWNCFLPESVALPLKLRCPRPGDRIEFPGGGTKKLGDVFTDGKVPLNLREVWAVLEDCEGNVIWLPGLQDSALMQLKDKALPFWHLTIRDGR